MIALFVFLAEGASALSFQNNPNPAATKTATGGQQQATNQPAPSIQNQQTSPATQQTTGSNAAQQDAEFAQKVVMWSAAIQAISAALIVAFTLALVIYSHRGWNVAATAANAAERSAKVAEKGLAISERAYLEIDDWQLGALSGHQVIALARMKATGRTPATVIGGEMRLSFDEPTAIRHTQPLLRGVVSHLLQAQQIIAFPGVPPETLQAWESGATAMFIAGYVRYRDAFQGTPVHRRHFCFRCMGPKGTFYLHQPGGLIVANYEEDEIEEQGQSED